MRGNVHVMYTTYGLSRDHRRCFELKSVHNTRLRLQQPENFENIQSVVDMGVCDCREQDSVRKSGRNDCRFPWSSMLEIENVRTAFYPSHLKLLRSQLDLTNILLRSLWLQAQIQQKINNGQILPAAIPIELKRRRDVLKDLVDSNKPPHPKKIQHGNPHK